MIINRVPGRKQRPDSTLAPQMNEMICSFRQASFLSKLNLKMAFHQLSSKDADIAKTLSKRSTDVSRFSYYQYICKNMSFL